MHKCRDPRVQLLYAQVATSIAVVVADASALVLIILETASVHASNTVALLLFIFLAALSSPIILVFERRNEGNFTNEAGVSFCVFLNACIVFYVSILALVAHVFMWIYDSSDTSVQATFASLVATAIFPQLATLYYHFKPSAITSRHAAYAYKELGRMSLEGG